MKMESIHNIGNPGGIYSRVIRKILKNKEIYPSLINQLQYEKCSFKTESVTTNRKVNAEKEKLFKPLLEFDFIWIYLHGSQADNTANSFSDYDDLIVVDVEKVSRKKLIKLIRALNKVELKFCRLDPLQHHSHWIISKQSLNNYDASYIPLYEIKNACRVKGLYRYCVSRTERSSA